MLPQGPVSNISHRRDPGAKGRRRATGEDEEELDHSAMEALLPQAMPFVYCDPAVEMILHRRKLCFRLYRLF